MTARMTERAFALLTGRTAKAERPHKFNAQPVIVTPDGGVYATATAKQLGITGQRFDSRGEGLRYLTLVQAARRGLITDLQPKPRFKLTVRGVPIGELRPDFAYRTADGLQVVEDFKGRRDRSRDVEYRFFRWKQAHLEAEHGVRVRVVTRPDDPVPPEAS